MSSIKISCHNVFVNNSIISLKYNRNYNETFKYCLYNFES